MTLGQRIQELRKQNQMSQEQLGEQMGVSRQAISKWESDLTIPEIDKLVALSKLFKVSLNDLLQVKDESGGAQPQVVLAPSKGWRIAMAVLAVATAASLALSGFLGWQMVRQNEQTQQQIAQLQEQMTGQLDPAALLASANYDFDFDVADPLAVDCTFTLSAAQKVDNMKVTLQLIGAVGEVQLEELDFQGGTVYSGDFSVKTYRAPYTVTALIETPGGTYTQPLVRWNSIGRHSWSWDALWEGITAG